MSTQTTPYIMMIRPSNFGFNEETAANNSFQTNDTSLSNNEVKQKAMKEFDHFVEKMRKQGIHVVVIEDSDTPVKPDAVFPNNWITFHNDGSVLTYPMYSSIRRNERRNDIIETLRDQFEITNTLRLENFESQNLFLEGTGSMILDRVNKIVYACTSPRTDKNLLEVFCQVQGYKKAVFQAVDAEGADIYHTNVMMALAEDFVVICMDTIKDAEQKQMLLDLFKKTNKKVINISFEQILSFAGNMLQVRNVSGDTFLIMSEQAFKSLNKKQVREIKKRTKILYSPINTIETFGGGSARCMMAEIFLPKKSES